MAHWHGAIEIVVVNAALDHADVAAEGAVVEDARVAELRRTGDAQSDHLRPGGVVVDPRLLALALGPAIGAFDDRVRVDFAGFCWEVVVGTCA